ncbi:hypoxanthine-guanine phosphoribosyltransferase [Dokdonella sp.]|uniref:hypoxanthine-guanine phosphoribosyltransferase n=1 Tax=Dokdonella sp. TaxID=2291710 RepID=UPI0031C990FA|nr:hypoxanthine-guanine phosphoribosyltransferase [Dokdonella sp.]
MDSADFSAVLARADLVHDQAALAAAIARVAAAIDHALAGRQGVFLTVMQGALIFAGQLATSIRAPLLFDYVHATRYRGATAGGELHWLRRPQVALAGASVLLVDDILDEGHTLKAIRDDCLAQGAAQVLVAVLCDKRHARRAPGIAADFIGVEVPDRYVFGYGMDYHEQGRNLPAIHAVDA